MVKHKSPDDVKLLREDTVTDASTRTGTQESSPEEGRVDVFVTPDKKTPHATLHPGYPTSQIDSLNPSDSGSVLRAAHTPDGSPGAGLDALYATFYRDGSSSELLSEVGSSPSNPRKRSAKAASLPDSVTDSERSYGGEKLKSKSRVLAKGRQSPVSSTSSTSTHRRTRSLIPRPMSVTKHVRPDPTKIPLPSNSVPVLDVEFRRFENSVPPVSPASPVESRADNNHVEHKHDTKVLSGELLTPRASITAKPGLDGSNGGAGKSLHGQDVERVSTVASAGSPCDTTLMSDSVDGWFGAFPTQEICVVQPDSPPCTFNRPRLVLIGGEFQVQASSDIDPGWYKASVTLVLRLQPGRPRGWFELVVPGLPRLAKNDHGYVYLRLPDDQGLEYRTSSFKRYEIVEGCLIAQFLPTQSKLTVPLRPCDAHFYGFLRDFKVIQTIRTQMMADKRNSAFCMVQYTAVCSLDLIQRDFCAEQCGFYIHIYGGPAGAFSCHLDTPKTDFHTIHLDSDPETAFGTTKLQVICTPLNLNMFVITWEMRVLRAEAISWMPRITALPDGSRVEEELQKRFLYAEKDELEVVRGEVKSRLVVPKRLSEGLGITAWLTRVTVWVFLLLPLFYPLGFYDRVLGDEASQKIQNVLCVNFLLCAPKSSGETEAILEDPKTAEMVVPMEDAELVSVSLPDVMDVQPEDPVRPISTSLRDRVDYFLGWKGPLAVDRV